MIKNIKELNLNWWQVPDHPYRILIFGGYFLVYSSTVLLQNMCVQNKQDTILLRNISVQSKWRLFLNLLITNHYYMPKMFPIRNFQILKNFRESSFLKLLLFRLFSKIFETSWNSHFLDYSSNFIINIYFWFDLNFSFDSSEPMGF